MGIGSADIDVSGVGYRAYLPDKDAMTLSVGSDVMVFTHHHVREDDEALYGFLSQADKEWFQLLLSVSGIGPKVALQIISATRFEDFALSVVGGDSSALAKLPGVGRKTADRLILELKDKLGKLDASFTGTSVVRKDATPSQGVVPKSAVMGLLDLVIEALETLGYNQRQATEAVHAVLSNDEDVTLEEGIRRSLQYLDSSATQSRVR